MEKKIRYTLGRNDKLKSRKLIEQLFSTGKSFSVFPFRVIYLLAVNEGKDHLQAGFSVGTKHFKKAVDRNRVKRLLREAYRLQKHPLANQLKESNKSLSVFFIYTGNELPEFDKVSERMNAALKRLQKTVHEDPVTPT